jgi:hypothetical protein
MGIYSLWWKPLHCVRVVGSMVCTGSNSCIFLTFTFLAASGDGSSGASYEKKGSSRGQHVAVQKAFTVEIEGDYRFCEAYASLARASCACI